MSNQPLLNNVQVKNMPRKWIAQRLILGVLIALIVYAYSEKSTVLIKKYADTVENAFQKNLSKPRPAISQKPIIPKQLKTIVTTNVPTGKIPLSNVPTSQVPISQAPMSNVPTSKVPTMLFMTRFTRDVNPKSRDPYLNNLINRHCPKKCNYTVDRSRLPKVDGVFLQGSEVTKGGTPRRYSPNQSFFLLLREPPGGVYYQKNFKYLPPYQINYTVGYVPGVDIYSGYDELVPKGFNFFGRTQNDNDSLNDWKYVTERAMNKTKGGFAVISNCNSYSKRELYLTELQKRYPQLINLFGKCWGGRCDYENCLEKNMIDHHFYFAFENIVCTNYVTEKFFRFKQLIVPVVLRKSDYVNLVPEGSYIAVDQFESIDALAKHLEFLMNNKEEYLKYFEWTKYFQRQSPSPIYRSLCKACQKLYEPNHQSSYENMLEWYSMNRHCDLDFVPRLLKKHTQSG